MGKWVAAVLLLSLCVPLAYVGFHMGRSVGYAVSHEQNFRRYLSVISYVVAGGCLVAVIYVLAH